MATKKTIAANLKAFIEGVEDLPDAVYGPVPEIEHRPGVKPPYIVIADAGSADDGSLDYGLDAVHSFKIAVFVADCEPRHREKVLAGGTSITGLYEYIDILKKHLQHTDRNSPAPIEGVEASLWVADEAPKKWNEKSSYLWSITSGWNIYAPHMTGQGV